MEVLVVAGCLGTEPSLARVREAVASLGIETNLRVAIVDTEERARTLGFKGSPTVRVEGVDVDADADARPVAIACRLYPGERGFDRAPPRAWIEAALARAAPPSTRS